MAKILVVEDEIIVAWDIKETLEKLGHTVVDLVVSGAEALASATSDSPDLVLMDIRLEGEMDGIAAGDEIYHQLKIPVIYLTAHADEITLARATKTDPFGYIIKPFQSLSLQSTIKVALQRHQVEESARLIQVHLTNSLNSIGDGIITTDRQGLVTFINPIAEDLTGWHSVDAIGVEIDRIFHLIWETDGTEIENPSSRAMRLKQPVQSPARCWLVAKDGLEIPISDTATPIVKPDGEIIGSIVVFQDNTEHLSTQMDLWEQNQDLEFFQLKLISQLQTKTAEYQQAIACIGILDLVLNKIPTAQSEQEMLQMAIEQLGTTIDADYCWVTLHDPQAATARIVCEYINPERQLDPTSSIGKEIDVLLHPEFYNHLFEIESWIDPPLEIIPSLYLDLLPPAAKILICPITVDLQGSEDKSQQGDNWTIGEVGILTTGKPDWTKAQANPISQILSCAVKIFRQTRLKSIVAIAEPRIDRESIDLSLEWLHSFKDEFINSIAKANRDMYMSAQMLQHQIHLFDVETKSLAVVRHHQFLHQQLAVNLEILQTEWRRQFQLIDILIDIQTDASLFKTQSISDILFGKWIAAICKSCADLAKQYHQDFSYQITDRLPPKLLCQLPILELMILELCNSACKYTPTDRPIILEIDIQDRQLQLSLISLGLEITATELEMIFQPFVRNLSSLSWKHNNTGLSLALVQKLAPHLGGKLRATSDRHSTRLILTVPMLGHDIQI